MKKFIYEVLCFTFLSSAAAAQSGWIQQNSGVTAALMSVFFVDSNTGFIAGTGNGTILKTTNGGTNWSNLSLGTGNSFNSIFFVQSTGYVVGNGGMIYKTINSGLSWVEQTSGTTFGLYSVVFTDANTGYAAGSDLDPPNSVILKTTNGGTNWNLLTLPIGSFGMRSLHFFDSNTGFVSGAFGRVIKTTNGGNTWISQNLLPNESNLISIYFSDLNTGYISGGDPFTGGLIFKTTNSGANWVQQLSGNNGYFYSVTLPAGAGESSVFASGESGKILRSSTGGVSWNSQISGVSSSIRSVVFTSSNTGYAVGNNGVILKTTTGGVVTGFTQSGSQLPNKFFLSQNFPNPFNPSTIINYQLAINSFVSVKIHNIIGDEVATLVNEKQNAGSYSVDFNAASLPSGVYYYKLFTGNFSETKKMVLIK